MARSTKEESLETRGRILDAAENLFYAQGVAQTSLADVAQAAGLTRGAIYWHFKNKNDLFNAMCERVRLPMEALLSSMADEREIDPLGRLRATLSFVLQDAADNPRSRKVLDIIFNKCELVDPNDPILIRHRESMAYGLSTIERTLANAVIKQQLPATLDTGRATILLHSMIVGLLNSWLFAPATFDLTSEAGAFVDACLAVLPHIALQKAGSATA